MADDLTLKKLLQEAVADYRDSEKSCGESDIFSGSDITQTTTYRYIADGDDLAVDLVIRKVRDGEFSS